MLDVHMVLTHTRRLIELGSLPNEFYTVVPFLVVATLDGSNGVMPDGWIRTIWILRLWFSMLPEALRCH